MPARFRIFRGARPWSTVAPLVPATLVCLGTLGAPLLPPPNFSVGTSGLPSASTAFQSRVRPLHAATASALLRILDELWATAGEAVPGLAPSRFPEDLDQLPVEARKRVFFRSLLPHVLERNERIAAARTRLLGLQRRLAAGEELAPVDLRFLNELTDRYRLDDAFTSDAEQIRALLVRVDVVPPSIALAQAAIESGWGTSRFSRLGNNLFGHWVFRNDDGIAPLRRPEGADYSLARFPDLGDAVSAYMRNLNGFYAYEEFRRLRREMRESQKPLDPLRLVAGLRHYSVRRDDYVRQVRSVIRGNRLTRFDRVRLTASGPTLPLAM